MNPDDNDHDPQQMKSRDASGCVRLRSVEARDLPGLFEYQLDSKSNELAGTYPRSAAEFNTHWDRIFSDPNVVARSILADDGLAGSISCFQSDERDFVGYWLGRQYWGRGIATRALELLLIEVSIRPLYACVAVANVNSLRVLQKCGFVIIEYQHCAGDDRLQECEEAILELVGNKRT